LDFCAIGAFWAFWAFWVFCAFWPFDALGHIICHALKPNPHNSHLCLKSAVQIEICMWKVVRNYSEHRYIIWFFEFYVVGFLGFSGFLGFGFLGFLGFLGFMGFLRF